MKAIIKIRKVIDIPEDVFKYLSIKAVEKGTNLKSYIEDLLVKDFEDMDDSSTYAYLSKTRPEGHEMLTKDEQKTFEEKYGL
jgi:oligoribonuclease NrnB/cAMP/cGMP phosphodiesterase (DHH superfamily)